MNADYHVHVTLTRDIPKAPSGWKKTNIVLLGRARELSEDIMLTKHYRLGHSVHTIQDILEDAYSLMEGDLLAGQVPPNELHRIKIEQTSGFSIPVCQKNYVEIHMLLPEGVEPKTKYWHKSYNPKRIVDGVKQYFYTCRKYKGESVHSIAAEVQLENIELPALDFRVEQLVYDSSRDTNTFERSMTWTYEFA